MVTFKEIVEAYGPYLGLILMLQISFMIMQFRWFRRVIRVKDQEIERLILREEAINKRLLFLIDQKIQFSGSESVTISQNQTS
ncbi:MAG: hypothetical protein MUC87_06045 [Bacteroidia bacterium]|jgi:hypothetical protein|nr:hypothetical protein [Bacteroidia bacterium]